MVVGELVITENKIRARQAEPEQFKKDSFRTIRLASGVKAIVGMKKEEDKNTIQSIMFDNTKYTTSQASVWLDKYKDCFSDALALEEKKAGLFEESLDEKFYEHLEYHIPPLSEDQITRLLEIIGPPLSEDEEEYAMINKYVRTV